MIKKNEIYLFIFKNINKNTHHGIIIFRIILNYTTHINSSAKFSSNIISYFERLCLSASVCSLAAISTFGSSGHFTSILLSATSITSITAR